MSAGSIGPWITRVDFFETSGIWYTTRYINFYGLFQIPGLHRAFNFALQRYFEENKNFNPLKIDLYAACLDPFHQDSQPIMILWKNSI